MTTQETFETVVASAIDCVLTSVSAYLDSEKDVKVSVADLRAALGVPATTPAATPARGRRPAAAAGTGAAKARGKSTVERRLEEQGQIEGLCNYVITRGDSKGYFCSNNATVGQYCSGCSKKKGPREEINKNLSSSSPSSAPGIAPGRRSTAMPPKEEIPVDEDEEIDAVEVDGYDDILLLPKLNLIIRGDDQVVIAHMVDGIPQALDDDAIERAKENGLEYDDSAFVDESDGAPQKEATPPKARPTRPRGRMPAPSR